MLKRRYIIWKKNGLHLKAMTAVVMMIVEVGMDLIGVVTVAIEEWA